MAPPDYGFADRFFLLTGILGWESGRSAAVAEKTDESYQYTLLSRGAAMDPAGLRG